MALGASTLLCLAVALAFSLQPDFCAAILILPRWLWILPGTILALLALTKRKRRMPVAVLALWLIFALVYMQELRSLLRPSHSPATAQKSASTLRVVSLNCSGYIEAAKETSAYNPDIILTEESPLCPHLAAAAKEIAGPEAESYCGIDVAMVVRGRITPVPLADKWNARFERAHVELASGLKVEVIVVRLSPYKIRADLWSPDCWRAQCEARRLQRQQLQRLAEEIDKVPRDVPLIVGGDFNLPAGDKMFRILPPRIQDAFPKCGSGWGDTLVNDFPFVRIDQIWPDASFRPISVTTHHTVNTDHRMVVCDLTVLQTR